MVHYEDNQSYGCLQHIGLMKGFIIDVCVPVIVILSVITVRVIFFFFARKDTGRIQVKDGVQVFKEVSKGSLVKDNSNFLIKSMTKGDSEINLVKGLKKVSVFVISLIFKDFVCVSLNFMFNCCSFQGRINFIKEG